MNPIQYVSTNSKQSKLFQYNFVVHLVKCLGKVKLDCVKIEALLEETKDFLIVTEKLTETGSALSKSMLTQIE